jgi:hypothetical protein
MVVSSDKACSSISPVGSNAFQKQQFLVDGRRMLLESATCVFPHLPPEAQFVYMRRANVLYKLLDSLERQQDVSQARIDQVATLIRYVCFAPGAEYPAGFHGMEKYNQDVRNIYGSICAAVRDNGYTDK